MLTLVQALPLLKRFAVLAFARYTRFLTLLSTWIRNGMEQVTGLRSYGLVDGVIGRFSTPLVSY